jgi:beta-lactamase regulating signal transducer with metallopeptidase domain
MISAAFWVVVKVSALLAVATVVQAARHRRSSAATRHLVWTLAVASVLLLPLLSLVLPAWPIAVHVTPVSVADRAVAAGTNNDPSGSVRLPAPDEGSALLPAHVTTPPSWPRAIAAIYAAGVLVVFLYLFVHRQRVRRFAREAIDLDDPAWTRLLHKSAADIGVHRVVRLLRSRECSMPMAVGTLAPAVLVPAIADTWAEDRRRAVMLHELAHVARCDCLTQSLAFTACALYWFHPAVWWVARRLRIERELACDDRVIAAGAGEREYASHLLEIAYSLGRYRAPALAVTMARPRQLEGRLLAVLDTARNRVVPSARVRFAGVIGATLVVASLAGATTTTVAAIEPQPRASDRLYWNAWSWLQSSRLVKAAAEMIGIAQNALPGTWEIRPTATDGIVHLRLVEWNSSSGSNIPIQLLEGLTAAQLAGPPGPVQFRMKRDAGTFMFEGVVRSGVGAGTFSFSPDVSFPAELVKRGFARPSAIEQYQLARHDIGYAFIDELTKQGYAKPATAELVRAGQHGVDVMYLRGMGTQGYRLGTLAPLIELRDHGVDLNYIRQLSEQGYKGLSAEDLRQARDHGVSPDYIRAMRDAGYAGLPMDQLINARDHGVDGEYVRGLGELGHRKLALDQVISARDHGVDIDFARGMASLGYSNLSLDALVRLRDHGVTPQYVKDVKALGYDGLSADDLVTLRDHGLTADRISSANKRAGTRLPVDMLKRLAAGGMQ